MRPSTSIVKHRDQVRTILEHAGLRNPKLFGSVARGQDTTQSDIDLLVDAPPGTNLYDLARVELALENLLGCKVDVVTKGFLAPDITVNVEADLTPIP